MCSTALQHAQFRLASLWSLELLVTSFSNTSITFGFNFVDFFSPFCYLFWFDRFSQNRYWQICSFMCPFSTVFLKRGYLGPWLRCFNSLLCSSMDVLTFPFKHFLLAKENIIPYWISSSLNTRENIYLVFIMCPKSHPSTVLSQSHIFLYFYFFFPI